MLRESWSYVMSSQTQSTCCDPLSHLPGPICKFLIPFCGTFFHSDVILKQNALICNESQSRPPALVPLWWWHTPLLVVLTRGQTVGGCAHTLGLVPARDCAHQSVILGSTEGRHTLGNARKPGVALGSAGAATQAEQRPNVPSQPVLQLSVLSPACTLSCGVYTPSAGCAHRGFAPGHSASTSALVMVLAHSQVCASHMSRLKQFVLWMLL